jgi:thiol-disulfide isomerase/thioredoxin
MLITMKKYIPIFILIFGLTLYLVSQGFLDGGDPTATQPAKQNKINKHYVEVLASFKGTSIEGEILSFTKPPKVLIVNFWASWCTPCLEEFPSLNSLLSKFQDKDLKVVGINTDEKDQIGKVKKIIKKYELSFPVVLDKEGKFINDFLVSTIPISIVYHNGKVMEVSKGSKDFMAEEFIEQVSAWLK